MDPRQAREICREVFGDWTERLAPHAATPVLALGVAHAGMVGAIHVCVREDPLMTDESVLLLLLEAVKRLDERIQARGASSPAASGPLSC